MKSKKLTPKQEAFCKYYMTNGFNATKAAEAAGYSEDTAYSQGARLLKDVDIDDRLNELKSKRTKKDKSLEDIREFWANMMDDPQANDNIRIKASELLGKHQGMFIERVENYNHNEPELIRYPSKKELGESIEKGTMATTSRTADRSTPEE